MNKEEAAIFPDSKFFYREYPVTVTESRVTFWDGTEFVSYDLAKHLQGCVQCAVFAATLGHETDRVIRLKSNIDLAEAVRLDTLANEEIERVCDRVCKDLAERAQRLDMVVTPRYSPGYGDFPLQAQTDVLRLSGAQKRIGMILGASNLLLPQKSVTALVGYRPTAECGVGSSWSQDPCKNCSFLKSCETRAQKERCGK